MLALSYLLLTLVHMCFQNVDRGRDALARTIENLNFVIEEFDRCDYVEQVETDQDDLTFVQLNVCGITNKKNKDIASI